MNSAEKETFFKEVDEACKKAIWCAVATVAGNVPRVRMVHPTWDGDVLWFAAGPETPKAKQLRANPNVDIQFQVAPPVRVPLRADRPCPDGRDSRPRVAEKERIVCQNQQAVAFVPWFARYAYEVFVVPREPAPSITDLRDSARAGLAAVWRAVLVRYDNLRQQPFPYVMPVHEPPTDGGSYPTYRSYLALSPPLRAPGLMKHLAGPETGAGTPLELARGKAEAFDFLRHLRITKNAVSPGGMESLASHPATTTHSEMSEDELAAAGVGDGLVRISVGVENWRDLVEEYEDALDAF